MPDDVPVAGFPLNSPTAFRGGILMPFELLFYGAAVGTTILVLASHGGSVAWQATFVAVTGALTIWYALVGHPAAARQASTVRAVVAAAGVLAAFTAALTLTPVAANLLVGLPALMFLILPDRLAPWFTVALCAAPTAVFLTRTQDLSEALRSSIPIGIASTIFALIISYVIRGISVRSHERARLIEELESTRAELARVSREAGIAEERQRLAGEIHDTVAQGLSSVVMLVQAAEASLDTDPESARPHLALAERTARENLAETRAIVAALTPAPLAEASLPEAVRRLAVGHATGGTTVSVTVTGEPRRASTAVEVVLLRAAQEGLANALRHAKADSVRLLLTYDPATILLEVRDDGRGFEPTENLPGYGLQTMRSRTVQVGGSLTIHSGPDAGTRLRIEVPT